MMQLHRGRVRAKKRKVMGHRDPEREAMPLKFHLKDGKLIDYVDPCQLGRALREQ